MKGVNMVKPMNLFVDMDGVLVNFEQGVRNLFGHDAFDKVRYKTDSEKAARNAKIQNHLKFWSDLPPMRDFDQLWNFIKHFRPDILTAYAEWDAVNSKNGKRIWNKKHLKVPDDKFHCVRRDHKKLYAKDHHGNPNVLIDDYPLNIKEWEEAGGIGILHTSAASTINRLKQLGFHP